MSAAAVVDGSHRPAPGGFGAIATVLLLVAAAGAKWLAFMPPEVPIATVAWLALFAIAAVGSSSPRTLWLGVIIVDLAWWLLVQRWIADVSVAGYPFLCGYLSLWALMLAWLVRRFAARESTARWPLWIVLPVLVVALDVLRGEFVLGGYPWYEAGQGVVTASGGWIEVAQAADLFGARGLTLLVALSAGAVAEGFRPRAAHVSLGRRFAGVVVAVSMWAAAFGYGHWRLGQADLAPSLGRFLAIQTALPIDNKIGWSAERQLVDVPAFADATQRALDEVGPPVDLVAWPETMLPGFGLDPTTLDMLERGGYFPGSLFAEIAHAVAWRAGAPLLVGSPVYVGLAAEEGRWTWDAHFNSVYLVPPTPTPGDREPPRYDKIVLTPFGETMPGISRFEWLEQLLLDIGARGMTFDLDAGSEPVRFEVETSEGDLVRVATPICFEATVASLCRRLVWDDGRRRADLLVNASNDGWLGDDLAARRMHLRLASIRAIENRTPMLRTVNTGFSAGIDSSGRIVAGLDGRGDRVGTAAGWVLAELPRDDRHPLFSVVGDRWALLAVLATAVGLWWSRMPKRDSSRGRG